MRSFIHKICLGVSVLIMSLSFTPSGVLAISDEQRRIIDSGAYYYNVDIQPCSVGQPNNDNRSVFMIGDSWLERLVGTQNSVTERFQNEFSYTAAANSSVGRSISGGGQKGETALEAIENTNLTSVGNVVVVLGTNPDNYDAQIPVLINAIKEKTDAKIFWVNSAVNSSGPQDTIAQTNAIIEKYAQELGYSVIDFFSVAFDPSVTPEAVANSGQNSDLLDTDGIHPKIPEGTDILSELIVSTVAGGANASSQPQGVQGSTSTQIPAEGQQRLELVRERVEQNLPIYQTLSVKHDMPWQFFAALHYREGGSNPDQSILGGEPLGQQAVDSDNRPETLEESGDAAFVLIRDLAKSVYDVELNSSSTFSDLQYAFLSYNRGFLYARVPTSEGGPWEPDISSYVMNFYDENHVGTGEGMEWPIGQSGLWGVRGEWGEPVYSPTNLAYTGEVPRIDSNPGAMTFLAYYGYTPPGGQYSSGCEGEETLGGFGTLAWPVLGNNSSPAGRITACWADVRNKTVTGGTYLHSGVDIAAAEGTTVASIQSGRIVFAGFSSTYGNLVIIEHSGGKLWSHYGHLVSIDSSVSVGESVEQGQTLGGVGNTGVSLGNHLHLNLYDRWPFGELPGGASSSDGRDTINPFTNGLGIPNDINDEASCQEYPDGGREVDIAL